jgi:hypothetical protein
MQELGARLLFPPAPDYAPFAPGPFRLSMGLRPLALQDWIEPDEHMAVELAEKEQLLRDHPQEVFAVLPEATESATEVLELLAAHLPARFPTLYRREGPVLTNLVMQRTWDLAQPALHPLDLAGRLVQEDLCLMACEGIAFILGHALYMKAIHRGKAQNDKSDAHQIAVLLRGGMMPMA